MALDEPRFESLLDQVRDLHRLADELTRSPRLHQHVQARLDWSGDAPALSMEQLEVANRAVDLLQTPRLSASQSRRLRRAFFGR